MAAGQTDEARTERTALLKQRALEESVTRGEEKQNRRPRKWDTRLARAIETIEELNGRLTDFGLTDDVVDTAELREKYLPAPPAQAEAGEGGEGEQSAE
jgi:hypothetical protein